MREIVPVAVAVPENAGTFQFVTDTEMLYAPSAVPAGDVTCKVVEPLAPAAKAKPVTPVVAVQPAGADSVNSNRVEPQAELSRLVTETV